MNENQTLTCAKCGEKRFRLSWQIARNGQWMIRVECHAGDYLMWASHTLTNCIIATARRGH